MPTDEQHAHTQGVFLEDGPTPRLCIDYIRNPTELEMNFFSQAMLRDKLQGAKWQLVFVIYPRWKVVCPESNCDVEKLKWFGTQQTCSVFTAEIDL